MATIVQRRRGTTAQHAAFTGALGEITVDTDKDVAVIHDGITPGGFPLAGTMFPNNFSEAQTINVVSAGPATSLDLQTDSLARINFFKTGDASFLRQEADTSLAALTLIRRGTTGNALAALSSGSGIGAINFLGYDGAAFAGAGAIRMFTSQAWVPGAHGTKLFFLTVPTGSTTQTTHATLDSTAFTLSVPLNMGTNLINNVVNPVAAQDAATKNYVDAGDAAGAPPFTDTTALVKGSGDPTKLMRFEVDGFTAATTRVLTPPNASIILVGADFANAWADGVTQTFNPNGTSAGVNVGSHTVDPSALNNGDIWYEATANELRARINGATIALGAGGSAPPFTDTNALVAGSGDPTKLMRFEVDGFTAGVTRVLTPPNADITLAGINITQTFALDQTFSSSIIVGAAITAAGSNFTVSAVGEVDVSGNFIHNVTDPISAQDAATKAYVDAAVTGGTPPFTDSIALVKGSADATKLMRFEVDGFTTGTTRVLTPPNADITLAGINIAQTFTEDQTFAKRILLPNTTSATVGGIYFGGDRAFHNFGTDNTFVGVNAGNFTMTGVGMNSFFGTNSGTANTTGQDNAFFGFSSGRSNTTGTGSAFFGSNTGRNNTIGVNNAFFGTLTGYNNIDGDNNSFFGRRAGYSNTTGNNNGLFGYRAGDNLTTGSNNIVLGYDIDSPTATNSNTLTIGNLIFGTGVDGAGVGISSGNVGIAVITPHSGLQVGRSFALPYRAISATDTFAATDYTIDATSGTFTLNLPTAVGITGRIYVAKNSGTGIVTLDANGAELIDGVTTQTINPMTSLTVQSTGAGWIII